MLSLRIVTYPGPNNTSQPSSEGNSQSGDDTHTLSPARRAGACGSESWANAAPGTVTNVTTIQAFRVVALQCLLA